MKIAFNPSTVAALTTPPNNKDITFDLRGRNIFARGVKFCGTDTNTWRDIKINNVSIGSNILDLRNGSNTTLTNTNGVVTINSTWRPVVDNLTSDSTTSSLSANQGRVLKALIDGKSNSGHTHDDRYLKLTGGTMASNALITFADSGSWGTDKGPQGARGGLYWSGQSDYAKLYAEETAEDNLDLVIQFGDDNSNGLSIRNKANTQTSYISAGGVITTGTFKGNLDWSYITNKPATATRWPSWAEVTGKPSSFTPSTHTHGLSNSVFFLNMPNISGNATWKEAFGYPVNYNLLLSVRINSPAPEWCVGNYGSGILYGGSDTKGFMSSAYNEPLIMWAGGNGSSNDSVPKWYIGIRGTHKSIYNLTTIASEANSAYNLRHSHANKLVLDGITSSLVNNWNVAYTFVNTITGTDTDKVINKWDEIVNFLAGITEDNKLNTLLNSKLSVYKLADNTNVGAIKNNGIYYSTSDASSSTLTNSPFNTGFALINMTSYDGGDDLRRSRLAFNAYGEIKVSNDRDLANTAETWYQILTSHNTYISNGSGIINGTTITLVSNADTTDGVHLEWSGQLTYDLYSWLAAWTNDGKKIKAVNKSLFATSGHTHDDRYYTKAESNAKYITDITTSINKLTFTKNGSNITRDIRVNNVLSLGRRNPLTERNAISGIYTYGTYSDTDNLAPSSYFETLGFGEGTVGTIEIGGSWISGGKLYWRALRDCCEDWFSWKTILDSSNYSGILDSRYYTESEVNSLLDAKLNRQNLSYGTWNPRGYNLAADYNYNGGDLSISENGGKMYVSIDGLFYQNEGLYRVLDTSDIGSIHGSLTLYQYLSSTDTNWFPLVWGGSDHKNTNNSTGSLYKSYDKLSWLTSSLTLYATNIQTENIKHLSIGGGIYWNPYVESTTDGSDTASITLVRLGVAGGTTLVLSLMNDANDTILFKTSDAARLYHNSYPILTTLNTYVSGNKGYINGTEITLVNNANLLDGLDWNNFFSRRFYTFNLSSYSLSNFYPLFFVDTDIELDCEIHSEDVNAENPYNQNRLHFQITSRGWSDTGLSFHLLSQNNYDNNEITIGSIGIGTRCGGICIWVRGGRTYRVYSNREPLFKSSNYTYCDEIYSVGTNIWGGTNTNVNLVWKNDSTRKNALIATLTDNVASATKLATARTIWGQSFDGTRDVSGFMKNVTGLIHGNNIGDDWSDGNNTHPWYGIDYRHCVDSAETGKAYTSISSYFGLYFKTGGSRFIFDGGNVGIGTNAPAYKLHVNGTFRAANSTVSDLFVNTGDATLKIYTGITADALNDGNICFLTSIDATDGQSHAYPTLYLNRCNIVLQPRGGLVYIGTNPGTGNTTYKLYVNSKIFSNGGFVKNGSSDSYVLLGGGGHKLESSLRVAYASNADMVDGYHAASFLKDMGGGNWNFNFNDGFNSGIYYVHSQYTQLNAPSIYGLILDASTDAGHLQLASDYNNKYYIRGCWWTGGGGTWDSWRTIIHSGNISSQSVNYATSSGNADTVDGYHATSGRTFTGNINWSNNWNDAWSDGTNKHPWYGFDHRYPNTGAYSTTISDFFGMTIKTANTLRLDFGTLLLNGTSIYSINVASATKLATARKIWGQSFDGTADISGTLSGVAHILFSADNTYNIGSNSAASKYIYTYWLGAKSGLKLELGANNSGYGLGLCIDTNLNVGIGTNAPTYKLHVAGDIYTTTGFKKNGSSDSYVLLGGGGHKLESALSVNYANSANASNRTKFLETFRQDSTTDTYGTSYPIWAQWANSTNVRLKCTNYTVWTDKADYATSAGNADTVDGTHLNGIFTAFGNNAHNITATIGGVTKSFLVNWAADSDKLDGYHENSFLRYRGDTSTDLEATLWSLIGIKLYNNALPDNLTGVYNYGSVISLPGSSSRFEIYTSHLSSNGNGLYYRSGWGSDKKTWLKFIDSSNIGSQSVNYANSAGNADKLDGIHANGLLTALSNSNNGISITVGGTTKSVSNISVNYAASAGNAASATNAYHLRINSADTWSTWYWTGLSGLPSWLWGSNDGTNMYVWDPNNFNVHTALYLRSLGNLNCQTGRTLNYGDVYTYNTYDGNTGSPTTFTSVIGFGRGIAGTVEIAGGWDNTNLYWRSLRDCCEDWHSWRTVLDSSNYTEYINNYYWANVKISTSSSTTTSPTVSNLTATNSIRMGNIYLLNTNEINSASGIHLNYQNSGNISLCYGGGNVGIGTISPSYKLDVNGNIHSSGTINCNALNVGSTLSIKNSVISCSASNISIESKESGSLLINSRQVLRYDLDSIDISNKTSFANRLGLTTGILGINYSTDDVTVLIGSLRESSSFEFRPAMDGLLLFLKVGKLYSNTYFWCIAKNCEVIKANNFGTYLARNSRKDCFGDGCARIFIYKLITESWYEFYCG